MSKNENFKTVHIADLRLDLFMKYMDEADFSEEKKFLFSNKIYNNEKVELTCFSISINQPGGNNVFYYHHFNNNKQQALEYFRTFFNNEVLKNGKKVFEIDDGQIILTELNNLDFNKEAKLYLYKEPHTTIERIIHGPAILSYIKDDLKIYRIIWEYIKHESSFSIKLLNPTKGKTTHNEYLESGLLNNYVEVEKGIYIGTTEGFRESSNNGLQATLQLCENYYYKKEDENGLFFKDSDFDIVGSTSKNKMDVVLEKHRKIKFLSKEYQFMLNSYIPGFIALKQTEDGYYFLKKEQFVKNFEFKKIEPPIGLNSTQLSNWKNEQNKKSKLEQIPTKIFNQLLIKREKTTEFQNLFNLNNVPKGLAVINLNSNEKYYLFQNEPKGHKLVEENVLEVELNFNGKIKRHQIFNIVDFHPLKNNKTGIPQNLQLYRFIKIRNKIYFVTFDKMEEGERVNIFIFSNKTNTVSNKLEFNSPLIKEYNFSRAEKDFEIRIENRIGSFNGTEVLTRDYSVYAKNGRVDKEGSQIEQLIIRGELVKIDESQVVGLSQIVQMDNELTPQDKQTAACFVLNGKLTKSVENYSLKNYKLTTFNEDLETINVTNTLRNGNQELKIEKIECAGGHIYRMTKIPSFNFDKIYEENGVDDKEIEKKFPQKIVDELIIKGFVFDKSSKKWTKEEFLKADFTRGDNYFIKKTTVEYSKPENINQNLKTPNLWPSHILLSNGFTLNDKIISNAIPLTGEIPRSININKELRPDALKLKEIEDQLKQINQCFSTNKNYIDNSEENSVKSQILEENKKDFENNFNVYTKYNKKQEQILFNVNLNEYKLKESFTETNLLRIYSLSLSTIPTMFSFLSYNNEGKYYKKEEIIPSKNLILKSILNKREIIEITPEKKIIITPQMEKDFLIKNKYQKLYEYYNNYKNEEIIKKEALKSSVELYKGKIIENVNVFPTKEKDVKQINENYINENFNFLTILNLLNENYKKDEIIKSYQKFNMKEKKAVSTLKLNENLISEKTLISSKRFFVEAIKLFLDDSYIIGKD